ncbi:LysR family transcriptional regulator [Undibacterium sp. Di27W]|uniref:LysR family transcriptional regulator n=1 Tax=Undibacterium sp. Di27W TaxID=3413036 RepID=UPI003BF457FA
MNIARPDLNLLVIFDAVASKGSVSKAAEQLALSQPAVSHALNRLRYLLDDPLFVRSKSGFLPTPRALAMIGPVRDILSAAGFVLSGHAFDPKTSKHVFRIGSSDYSNTTLIPALVQACRVAAPNITLDIIPAGKTSYEQLAAGELDCSFWASHAPELPWRSSHLFSEHLVGMVANTHPLARKSRKQGISLDEYLAYPHIIVSLRDPGKNPVDDALAQLGRSRTIRVVTQSFSTNMASLAGSDLIASLPSRLSDDARRQNIVMFDLPLELVSYDYMLAWHRRTDTDPAAIWLRMLIEQVALPDKQVLAGDKVSKGNGK